VGNVVFKALLAHHKKIEQGKTVVRVFSFLNDYLGCKSFSNP
jgi:hypothetical protein